MGTAGVVMGTAGVVVGIAGVEKLGRDVNNTTGIKLGGSSKLTEIGRASCRERVSSPV